MNLFLSVNARFRSDKHNYESPGLGLHKEYRDYEHFKERFPDKLILNVIEFFNVSRGFELNIFSPVAPGTEFRVELRCCYRVNFRVTITNKFSDVRKLS